MSIFTLCTILDELAYVEIVNGKFIIEVIIPNQQHEYLFNNSDFICYGSKLI